MTAPASSPVSCAGDTIVAEVVIRVPRDAVWRALTDGDLLGAWWGSDDTYHGRWELDLRVGGRWIARGEGTDGKPFTVGGEFLEIAPVDRLAMTWGPDWAPIPPTTIRYDLTPDGPTGDATRLRLTHTGFAGYPGADAARDSHAAGWQRVLGWLAQFVERGS